jgi:hypothetical protein
MTDTSSDLHLRLFALSRVGLVVDGRSSQNSVPRFCFCAAVSPKRAGRFHRTRHKTQPRHRNAGTELGAAYRHPHWPTG